MANHICFTVADRSYFSLLKKEIHAIASSAGFSENKVGEIDIIVAEIVTNLVKHAGGGKLLAKLIKEDDVDGIELISIDSGEGMADVNRMMVDGISTKNSLGQGLGAIKRMSDVFQVYTQKGWGTILLARIFKEELPYKRKKNEIRSLVVPKPGEVKCGDGFFCNVTNEDVRIFCGDGLGHGEPASAAVHEAITAFQLCAETSPADIIRHIHDKVKKTRGLVGTAAIYSIKNKVWRLCGVGNIATRIINGIDTKNYMAYNGIIGHNIPTTLKDTEIDWINGQTLIMCSDGIKTRWEHAKYPALLKFDLSILTAVVFKDFARFTDDMSVAAIKLNF
jgi:anti-sigma regulatory factor (Ser/Thr protein kinase)